MTHLELENVASEFVEERLDAGLRGAVEAHLESCAACRELVADIRLVAAACHSTPMLEPPPWLARKILRATIGEKQPSLWSRAAGLFRPALNPRFAYSVAMAVFSFSIILGASGVSLRKVSLSDLNPSTLLRRATSTGELLYAHAEKFYYDLRFVYEIESRFRQLRGEPAQPPAGQRQEGGKETAPQENPPGGSTSSQPPGGSELALNREPGIPGAPGSAKNLEAAKAWRKVSK